MADGDGPAFALLLFCGLPAAGKSHLARRLLSEGPRLLLEHFAPRGVRAVRVWHVSFDAVLEALQADRGVAEFDPALWRDSRTSVFEAVRAFVSADGPAAGLVLPGSAPNEAYGDASAPHMHVVLLDDNMQFRSMRRAYYQLAREAQVAVCTLGLPISLDFALARNTQRPPAQRVDDETIRRMAEMLQWPQPERHGWERGWLRLPEPSADKGTGGSADGGEGGAADADGGGEVGGSEAPFPWAALAAALADGVPRAPTDAERAAAREAAAAAAAQTAASASHQLDLRLRQAAGTYMQQLKGVDAARRPALARGLTELKKQLLQSRKATWAQRGPPCDAAALEEELEAASDELDAAFGRVRLL